MSLWFAATRYCSILVKNHLIPLKTERMRNLYLNLNFRRLSLFREELRLTSSIPNGLSSKKFSYSISLVIAMLFAAACFAQTGINAFTSTMGTATNGQTYTGPGCGVSAQSEYIPTNNNTFNYRFGTSSGTNVGTRAVNGYTAGNAAYSVIANVVTGVVMRRVILGGVTANNNRDILFFAGNRTPGINIGGQTNSNLTVNLNAGYVADMGTAFSQNNLLIGTDNIFSNTGNGNGNNNQIERVDVMIGAGYTIPDVYKYGFPILERGVYGAHDAFKIAIILAVDNLGNPTAYSNVVSVASANYNNASSANPVPDGTYNYFLFRRNGNSSLQINQHITDQGIGGVAFRFADFGIANGTTIYGYSIMANDFNSTNGADVINYTNTARFPTTTNETIGGLDILAVLGIAMQTTILPVELSSFTAVVKENKTMLQWTTATEMNDRGFQVERSANGKEWTAIGFVNTKATDGNSGEDLHYTFFDNTPAKGANYYRLVQVDLDDFKKTSEIKTVYMGEKNANSIKMFPNPVANVLHIEGIEPGTNFKIVDLKGTELYKSAATSSNQAVSTEKLSPGIYFLQIKKNDGRQETMRVVKM